MVEASGSIVEASGSTVEAILSGIHSFPSARKWPRRGEFFSFVLRLGIATMREGLAAANARSGGVAKAAGRLIEWDGGAVRGPVAPRMLADSPIIRPASVMMSATATINRLEKGNHEKKRVAR